MQCNNFDKPTVQGLPSVIAAACELSMEGIEFKAELAWWAGRMWGASGVRIHSPWSLGGLLTNALASIYGICRESHPSKFEDFCNTEPKEVEMK